MSGFPYRGISRCTRAVSCGRRRLHIRVRGRHARVPCVSACACLSWPGRAGLPPGRVLVRLTFSLAVLRTCFVSAAPCRLELPCFCLFPPFLSLLCVVFCAVVLTSPSAFVFGAVCLPPRRLFGVSVFSCCPLRLVFLPPGSLAPCTWHLRPPPRRCFFLFVFFLGVAAGYCRFFLFLFPGGGGGCPAPDFCRACSPCGAVCHAVPPLVAFVPLLWCASWWWWCCPLLPPPGPSQFKFQPPHSECVGPGLVPLGDQEKGGQTFCCPYPPEQK